MGLYDIIDHSMACFHCDAKQLFDIEVRFQNADLNTYKIGSQLIEANRKLKDSSFIIDGYCECIYCHRDFFVAVQVVNKTIISIEVDPSKPGYINK